MHALKLLMDGLTLGLHTTMKEINSVLTQKAVKLGNSTLMMKYSILKKSKISISKYMEPYPMKVSSTMPMFTLSSKPSPHLMSGSISMTQMVTSVIFRQNSLRMELQLPASTLLILGNYAHSLLKDGHILPLQSMRQDIQFLTSDQMEKNGYSMIMTLCSLTTKNLKIFTSVFMPPKNLMIISTTKTILFFLKLTLHHSNISITMTQMDTSVN